MAFSEILGHQRQVQVIQRSLDRDRLHHAYLFIGPEGVGKKKVALSLAAAVHCSGMRGDSCGRCNDCRQVIEGNHPDVRLVEPEAGKREITIQQIRNLQRMLGFRSFSGKKKVAIIDSARLMNYHAQNSLLKTLEDPPGDALLILLDHSTGGLLTTVVSRCLRLYFPQLSVEQVARILTLERGMGEEEATLLAAVTGGSLGEALSANGKELISRRRDWLQRYLSLSRRDFRAAMALAEDLGRDREKATAFVRWMKDWYRDILFLQMGCTGELIKNKDMVQALGEMAPTLSLDQTLSVLERLERVAGNLQKNYNGRLVMEEFILGRWLNASRRNPQPAI